MSDATVIPIRRSCLVCEGSGRYLLRQVRQRPDGLHVPQGGVEVLCRHTVGYLHGGGDGAA